MPVARASAEELRHYGQLIDGWIAESLATNPLLTSAEHDSQSGRWYLRMKGEEKSVITVWLTLRERTLHFETYFMPSPEERQADCMEYLLRINTRLFAWRFAIGEEDAIYLVGQLPLGAIDAEELDRVVGSGYAYSEQYFRPAMRIGYATQFGR